MKFTLALFLALFAVSALAQVTELPADAVVAEDTAYAHPELTEGEQVEEAPKELALYTAAEHEEAHEEAKASITELLASGKSSTACSNLAGAAKKGVTDSVAASQKVIAGMPNGSQCKNQGSSLVTKANGDKTKADKASADALQKLNDAKNAQIDFGKFKVSSLKEGQCGSFFNTQAWKDAKSKITNADKAYTTAKTKASDAAKAVDTAKKESAKLVKKCKCDSKTAIEKAIKDMNAKSKSANQAEWSKAYHMDCVLAGKDAKSCTVPALPTVQPVKFSADVKDSCSSGSGPSPIVGRKQCSSDVSGSGKNDMKVLFRTGTKSQDWKYGCFLESFVPAQRTGMYGAEVTYGYAQHSNKNTGQSAMWGLRHIKKDDKPDTDHRYQEIDYALYCSNAQGNGANMYAYEKGSGHQLSGFKCIYNGQPLRTRIVIEPDQTVTYWGYYGGSWKKMGTGKKKAQKNKSYVLDTSVYGGRIQLQNLKIIHSAATSGSSGFSQVSNAGGNSAPAPSSGGSSANTAGALKIKKFKENTGGSQNNKPFELVKFPATQGWNNDKASMDKYINFCASKGMKAVGCGTSSWDASKDSKSIAMPASWSCNMLNNLAGSARGDMGKNIVALQTTINYGSSTWLYAWGTTYEQPTSNKALSPVCGAHQ